MKLCQAVEIVIVDAGAINQQLLWAAAAIWHAYFRAAVGVGYEFDNGSTLTTSWDDRSNGDKRATNPGLETLSISYAISLD